MYTCICTVKGTSPQFLVVFTPSMAQPSTLLPTMRMLPGANVRRLMAQLNMTQSEAASATGLDERTLRSILQGDTQPHARTLHKLAGGLGVSVDELFQDPSQRSDGQYSASVFDRATNPVAAQAVDAHPKLFKGWTATDFDELFSRMAVGGELTEAGTLASARAMNERRELMHKVAVVLESSEGDLMRDFIDMLYRRATTIE